MFLGGVWYLLMVVLAALRQVNLLRKVGSNKQMQQTQQTRHATILQLRVARDFGKGHYELPVSCNIFGLLPAAMFRKFASRFLILRSITKQRPSSTRNLYKSTKQARVLRFGSRFQSFMKNFTRKAVPDCTVVAVVAVVGTQTGYGDEGFALHTLHRRQGCSQTSG